jgi:channel protein (hemolysin III family)
LSVTVTSIYPIPGFQDPVSSFSHLLGAGVFAALSVPLLWRGWGRAGRVAALALFAFSVVFLLSMSGVYHLLAIDGTGRMVMQVLDHAAIFVLIAGTFTPVAILLFKGPPRWGILLVGWTAAVNGVVLKTIFFDDVPEGLSVSLYLAMGWFGAIAGYALWRRYGLRFIQDLIWGALAYTVGAVVDYLRWPALIPGVVGPHELFHVLVLAGIAFHWSFVYRCTGELPAGGPTFPADDSGWPEAAPVNLQEEFNRHGSAQDHRGVVRGASR